MQFHEFEADPFLELQAVMLEQSPDYRVLRRLPKLGELWLASTSAAGPATTLAIIDVKTSGFGGSDRMIELAVLKIGLTADGQLCEIEEPVTQLEDPRVPIAPDITALTGIDASMVKLQRFDEVALADALSGAEAFVAFDAAAASSAWSQRFPDLHVPWLCARQDVNWLREGHAEMTLEGILSAKGYFYDAHIAAADTWALAVLLAMPAQDHPTIAAQLVEKGRSRIAG